MTFPYDFGFLPRTLAPDGDPIDVLLLMDEPAYPGSAVRARLIGVMEGEQLVARRKSGTTGSSPAPRQTIATQISESLETCPPNGFTNCRTSS
jgi:Inorganic pyrophosphatase